MSVSVRPSPCPTCGVELGFHTPLDGGRAPAPGDVTMCTACGELLRFDGALVLYLPPADELVDVLDDHQFNALRLAQRALRGLLPQPDGDVHA